MTEILGKMRKLFFKPIKFVLLSNTSPFYLPAKYDKIGLPLAALNRHDWNGKVRV